MIRMGLILIVTVGGGGPAGLGHQGVELWVHRDSLEGSHVWL